MIWSARLLLVASRFGTVERGLLGGMFFAEKKNSWAIVHGTLQRLTGTGPVLPENVCFFHFTLLFFSSAKQWKQQKLPSTATEHLGGNCLPSQKIRSLLLPQTWMGVIGQQTLFVLVRCRRTCSLALPASVLLVVAFSFSCLGFGNTEVRVPNQTNSSAFQKHS